MTSMARVPRKVGEKRREGGDSEQTILARTPVRQSSTARRSDFPARKVLATRRAGEENSRVDERRPPTHRRGVPHATHLPRLVFAGPDPGPRAGGRPAVPVAEGPLAAG